MRLLIAGVGLIGRRHLEHASDLPGIDVVGLIDPMAPTDLRPDLPRFDSIGAVNVDADAVIIATPSNLHADHAEQAASRGWHMLIEKPVASDLAGADRIIAAADQAGVRTLVGHHRRHHGHVAKLKELLETGAIGKPVSANLMWSMKKPDDYFDGTWRQGHDGSPVMINLVHEVDTLRFLFGDLADVVGFGSNAIRGAGRVESGGALLRFEAGLTVAITFADTTPTPWGFEAGTGENPNIATTGQDMLHIAGTTGAVSFPSLTVWRGAADWSEAPKPAIQQAAQTVPLAAQLLHFRDLASGQATSIADAREGRKTLAATLAIEAAVSQGINTE